MHATTLSFYTHGFARELRRCFASSKMFCLGNIIMECMVSMDVCFEFQIMILTLLARISWIYICITIITSNMWILISSNDILISTSNIYIYIYIFIFVFKLEHAEGFEYPPHIKIAITLSSHYWSSHCPTNLKFTSTAS